MRHKFLFVVGLGVGYVLGSRAGRPRYEKIKARATAMWEDPRVEKARLEAQSFVKENAPVVQEKVVTGAKAAVTGVHVTYTKAAETAKEASSHVAKTAMDISENVARTTKDVSENLTKTAKGVRDRITSRGEDVVDGVIIAAVTARDSALESDSDDDDDDDESVSHP